MAGLTNSFAHNVEGNFCNFFIWPSQLLFIDFSPWPVNDRFEGVLNFFKFFFFYFTPKSKLFYYKNYFVNYFDLDCLHMLYILIYVYIYLYLFYMCA